MFFIQSIIAILFITKNAQDKTCALIKINYSSVLLPVSIGFIVGNKRISLIVLAFVNNITSLSIPIPIPPVGAIPYSRAIMKSSSIILASSSPLALSSS